MRNAISIEHSLEIFRDQVELEVNEIFGPRRLQIRPCSGVRDDPNRETFLGYFRHRQADPVDRDGTFVSNIMRKLGGQFDFEPLVRAVLFQGQNADSAIHMALDEMAPETPIRRKSALEIDAAVAPQGLHIGAIESLCEKVEGELVTAMRRDRQAAAIHRDAVADPDFLCDKGRDDLKLRPPLGRGEPQDTADFFNQTGKHELMATD